MHRVHGVLVAGDGGEVRAAVSAPGSAASTRCTGTAHVKAVPVTPAARGPHRRGPPPPAAASASYPRSAIILAAAMGTAGTAKAAMAAGPAASYQVGPITDVSSCGGQNAEVEQAVDSGLGYVYADWMGCKGIALARSADFGRAWGAI